MALGNILSGGVHKSGHLSAIEHMTEPALPRDARILVVDDNEDILHAARLLLKRHFTSVQTLNDPAQLAAVYRTVLTGQRALLRAREVLDAGGVPLLGLAETFV